MKTIKEINQIIEDYILSFKIGVYTYQEIFECNHKANNVDTQKQKEFANLKKEIDNNTLKMYFRNKVCDLKKNDKISGGRSKIIIVDAKTKTALDKFDKAILNFKSNSKKLTNQNICYQFNKILSNNTNDLNYSKWLIYITKNYLEELNLNQFEDIFLNNYPYIKLIPDESAIEYSLKEYLSTKHIREDKLDTLNTFVKKNKIALYDVFRKYAKSLKLRNCLVFIKNIKKYNKHTNSK